MPRCVFSASPIWKPTVKQGLRLDIGSWKIIAMSLPISARLRRGESCKEVLAAEGEAVGGDRRRLRQEAHDGEHGDRLAGAGLADDRHDLARVDVEIDAVDGLERPGGGGEGDGEVADFEKGHSSWISLAIKNYIDCRGISLCRLIRVLTRYRPRSLIPGPTGPQPGY